MAVDVQALYAAIAAQVAAAVSGLETSVFVPDAVPSLPFFYPAEWQQDLTVSFGPTEGWQVTARVLVARADDRERLGRLAPFLAASGPKSIRAALAVDRSFGGSCSDSMVTALSGAKLYAFGAETFFGGEFKMTIVG